jgi:uncharacterized protein (TIGR02996 family)
VRDELLRRLSANPEDREAWLAFADWLQQAGDPRGELIALDDALDREPKTKSARRGELEAARTELLAAQGPALLGETLARAVGDGYLELGWRRGFVERVHASGEGLPHRRAVGWVIQLLGGEPFLFVRRVELPFTDVTDVAWLDGYAHLEEVDLRGCRVSPEKIVLLRKRGLKVRHSQDGR